MRPAKYRDKVKKMQNHVSCLQSRAKSLQREQSTIQLQVDMFEGLLCVRDAWAGVIKAVLLPGWECDELLHVAQQGADEELQKLLVERSQAPEHVLQQLPLLPSFSVSHVNRALHKSVMGLTPEQAARQWVAYVSDTMQLLVMHALDPELADPLLDAHMKNMASWLLSLYFFNTDVAFELLSMNLVTMQKQPAPAGHWQAALAAANLTEQQRTQIAMANLFCQPRLRQLQQEQQALMQQLTELHESSSSSSATQDSRTEAAAAAAAASGQPGPASPLPLGLLDRPAGFKSEVPAGAAVMLASERLQASLASSVKTEAESGVSGVSEGGAAAGSIGRSGSSGSGSGGAAGSSANPAGDSSNHARQRQMDRANELTQQMATNCRAWRILTSMRGQYSAALLTPLQFAKMVTAAAPYLLIGAPIYDEVIAENQTLLVPKKKGRA